MDSSSTCTLILQGLTIDRPSIDHIAQLIEAHNVVEVHPTAWACENAHYSKDLKALLDKECFDSKLDYAFIDPNLNLTDFKLLVMDMDSTLVTIECIDEIADMQGLKPQVAEITAAAMRGEMDFKESLTRRVALLKGLDASALQRVYDERLKLSPGAENLLKKVKEAGLQTLLVSGGFTFFTEKIKSRLGLDYMNSNALEIVDGKLTGKVVGDIVDAEEKKNTVERVCGELDISPKQTIVIGDGANDLKMMAIAGISVAYRAKPIVRAQADVALNFVGLDGVLALFKDSRQNEDKSTKK